MLTIVLDKELECTIVYVRCDSGYDGYHETHLIVTVYSEFVPSRLGRQMRIRPPELETSICDVKYHVSLSTGCVLGKWVCLVTLAMSLFNLQDVCIAIGSLATLDLPMVVDLIGIYVLKGPYSSNSRPPLSSSTSPPPTAQRRCPPATAAVARISRVRTCSDQRDEENPIVLKSVRSSSAD
ncbi:F-box family protein [Dorcoceras hygrometricum]|uniref:F-box family protein n=1 Tax=Dorcoceras hygrometricum TaxID=472368 RepID=A0A2Z7DE70_9LAMI|nr:F-box family protein [Dorcoceras hygrometricum]